MAAFFAGKKHDDNVLLPPVTRNRDESRRCFWCEQETKQRPCISWDQGVSWVNAEAMFAQFDRK